MAAYYFIRIGLILVLSLILKALIPPRVRDRITPFFAGWCLFGETAILTLPQWGVVPFAFVGYIGMAFLLDGLDLRMMRNNAVLMFFFLFWGMLLASTFWGEDTLSAFAYYLYILIDLTLIGFYLGMWAVRTPGGLQRLLKTMVVFGFVALVMLVLNRGALTGSLDDFGGRFAVNMDMVGKQDVSGINVNNFAIACSSILIISLVFIFIEHTNKQSVVLRWMAIANVVVSVVMIIRTGSRNGVLAFLPCAWFAMSARRKQSFGFALAVNILILLSIVIMIYLFTSGQGTLRAFDFSSSWVDPYRGSTMDRITSGRWGSFEAQISQMSGSDWLIGRGTVWAVYEMGANAVVWGALCIYVTVFVVSGGLGLFLMLCYFIATVRRSLQIGELGKIAILMFSVWAILGVGEGESLMRGYVIRLYQGMSIAFCTHMVFRRQNDGRWIGDNFGYRNG